MIAIELQRFLAALMFFSRIPCPATWQGSPDRALRHAGRYFPLVGWLVGAISAGVIWLSLRVFPTPVAVLLGMGTAMLLTGAMHEDAFADSCDGFGGGWTREQTLHIMQDSRIGAYGAVGLMMLLALKFTALISLHPDRLLLAWVAGHAISRLIAISFLRTHTYARLEGTGKSHAVAQRISLSDLAVAAVFGLLPLVLLPARQALPALTTLMVIRLLAGRYLTRRLGGYTGDCLGAVQQLCEVLFYLTVLALP